MNNRMCNICNVEFPLSKEYFHRNKHSKDGYVSRCKKCTNEIVKERYHKDIMKSRKIGREDYKKNKKRKWSSGLKTRYGITSYEYNNLLESQNSKCGICGMDQNKLKKRLHVDHNHNTGEIRGLICKSCNLAIGLIKDDISILNKMIKYLVKK